MELPAHGGLRQSLCAEGNPGEGSGRRWVQGSGGICKIQLRGRFGELLVDTVCTVYYQRTAGFEKDKDFIANYECTEEDTLEALVGKIRAYWGWQT